MEYPLKYDFVVHPLADYKNIKVKFLNAQNISVSDEDTKLKIQTIAGNIEEGKLVSYIKSEKRKANTEILVAKSNYLIDKDSIVSFSIAEYDKNKTLIIDPLVWATYYGGNAWNSFLSVCIDKQDNVYITGLTNATNFPAKQLAGAYWQPDSLTTDAFILKFDKLGVRQWATYYGGSMRDIGISVSTDNQDNVYVSGSTESTDFPTQQSAGYYWQANNAGIWDLFILKFNNQGIRQWATYYGGNSSDNLNSLFIDKQNNLYLIGLTLSSNFPLQQLTLAYNQTTYAGATDAFIVKFDNLGVRQWATYYGGSLKDEFKSIYTDSQNNVIIVGRTVSLNFPTQQKTGAYWQANHAGGNYDMILLKFNDQGVRDWATYYGGSSEDEANSICTDSQDNIYITGYTNSLNFPTQQLSGAYWQTKNGINTYILKFNNQEIRQWATFYGGSGSDNANAICSDNFDNIYITGYTMSANFPLQQLTGEYWQSTINGFQSSFILRFSKTGKRIWATFYGCTNNINIGNDITSNNKNTVYIIGESWGNDAYTVDCGNGAYYNDGSNSNMDSYILKICNVYIPDSISTDRNNLCINDNGYITLTATGGEGDNLKWYSDGCGLKYVGMNSPLIIPIPNKTTTFYARWETICGNSECETITIIVKNCEIILEIPNIITINNDGINDLFVPIKIMNIEKTYTRIFNRWGNLVYETDKLNIEWDGKYKGQTVADGVYYYIINYTDINGKEKVMKGSLTVMR
jgi:gliding motility-associated-like protein